MSRYLTRARDEILRRRYCAKPPRHTRRIAIAWPRDVGGALQLLQGHACQAKTRDGRLFNRRNRLVRRLGLSAYVRTSD